MPAFTKSFVERAEPKPCPKCAGTGRTGDVRCKRCRGLGKVAALFWKENHGLKVTPAGSQVYSSQYRLGGRGAPTKLVTIGTHGRPWTPEKAWKEHKRIQGLVAQGRDPAAEKRTKREAAKRHQVVDNARALEVVATRWFNDLRRRGKSSADEVERSFRRHVYGGLGERPIEAVAKADAYALYERLADADHASMGHQLCRNLKACLSFAVERGLIQSNPLLRIKLPQLESRDRVLIVFHPEQEPDPTELLMVWRAADQLPEPQQAFVKVLILTLAREVEVAGMPYAELLNGGVWRLPKERHKGRRGYDIPLPTQALKLIAALPREREIGDVMVPNEFVFSGRGDRPIGDFSKIKADLDAAILKAARESDPKAKPLPHWRLHDLRRSGSSWIEEEFGGEVMHACLGHSLGERLRKVYAHGSGWKRKRRGLQAWADFVTGAAAQVDGSNVVHMTRGR